MTLGHYRIESLLGKGGMGAVYRAVDSTVDRPVALKVIRADHCRDARFMQRFRREGNAATEIDHPGVARVYDAGEIDGTAYLALELVEGSSLDVHLRGSGRLPWRDAARYGAQMAAALAAVHAAGFIHRDVKPANVLLDQNNRVKLTDFGLVRRVSQAEALAAGLSVELTKSGDVVGTPQYMSPEQIEGSRGRVAPATDLYALGVTLYEMLTGNVPFTGSGISIMKAHLFEKPPSIRSIVPEAPKDLEAIIGRLLEKEPADRGDATGAARELGRIAKIGAAAARGGPSPALLAAGAAVLVAAAVGAWVFLGGASGVGPPETGGTSEGGETTTAGSGETPAGPTEPAPDAAMVLDDQGRPEWYNELDNRARVRFPLPDGLAFGEAPGEYVNVKDGSVLLFIPRVKRAWVGAKREPHVARWGPGSYVGPDENRMHAVNLSKFLIGKHEVTVEQFRRFVAAEGHVTAVEQDADHDRGAIGTDPGWGNDAKVRTEADPKEHRIEGASWRSPDGPGSEPPPSHPVVQVTWDDAKAYCAWAGLELPTESQWEWAASRAREIDGPTRQRWPWGDDDPSALPEPVGNLYDEGSVPDGPRHGRFAGYDDDFRSRAPVGSFPAGASPFGVLDMAGNVWELTRDVHAGVEQYSGRDGATDPVGVLGAGAHVIRGGSYAWDRDRSHITYRSTVLPKVARADIGFRVIRELD